MKKPTLAAAVLTAALLTAVAAPTSASAAVDDYQAASQGSGSGVAVHIGSGLVSGDRTSTVTTGATPTCTTVDCYGLDPSKTNCVDDAKTIAAEDVGSGMLEERWSKNCQAAWGRYTPYRRPELFGLVFGGPTISWARVTAWIDGVESVETAGSVFAVDGSTYWSGMVPGNVKACVGVEPYSSLPTPSGAPPSNDSLGFSWGPCA